MKQLLILALAILAAVALAGNSYAESAFWDVDETHDPTITEKDFTYKFKDKTPTDFTAYDDAGEPIVEEMEDEYLLTRPARPRASVEQPRRREPSSVRPRTRLRRTPTPRPSIGKREEPKVELREPKKESEKKSNAPDPSQITDKRGKKSLKWGQVEVKPAKPEKKSDLQWGREKK
jgi:hypothetical protein